MSEPLRRAGRLCFYEPLDTRAGVFSRVAVSGSGRVGLSSNCITCVMGSKDSPEAEAECVVKEGQDRSNQRQTRVRGQQPPAPLPKLCVEASPQAGLRPFPRSTARQTLADWRLRPETEPPHREVQSCSVPRKCPQNAVKPAPTLGVDCRTHVHRQLALCTELPDRPKRNGCLLLSSSSSSLSSSSLSSLESSPALPPASLFDSRRRAVGTLQRELNALFTQKMEELHLKSPMFFAGKVS